MPTFSFVPPETPTQYPAISLVDENGVIMVPGGVGAGVTSVNGETGAVDLTGTFVGDAELAAMPELLIVGAITRDGNGAALSAAVVWPNGDPGTYTATDLSTSHAGAVDGYTITKGDPVAVTYTQPPVTRDATGAVSLRPAITAA